MTDSPQSPTRYSTLAIVLHWALAALLLFQLSLGWRLEELPRGAGQFTAFQLHKSIGISILLLSLARLGLRLVFPRPATWPDGRLASLLAKGVHVLLYVVMIGGPLTGWVLVSTAKIKMQTMLFGTVPWPSLPLGAGWHEPAEGLHALLGYLLVELFVLHVAGALRHHSKREDLIGRMLPPAIASHAAVGWAAGLAVVALLGAMAWAKVMPFGESAQVAPAAVASAPVEASQEAASEAAPASDAASSEASDAASEAASEAASTAATAWRIEPGGRLGFRADYSGSPVDGTFKRWDADVVFSPEDLAHSRIRVSVDLASADTADSQRDDMLKSDSFFNVTAHPRATFTSSSIRARGPGKYTAAGTLAMHGVSRPLTLNFDLAIDGDRATASGSAQLNRTAYGVGSGEWSSTSDIKDGVSVTFRLKAQRSKQ